MPEPTPNAEEMLKACAARRRSEAGPRFELDSIQRAALHREVERVGPDAGRGAPAQQGGWAAWWPRWTFASALVAVTIAAWLMWRPVPSRPMAADPGFLAGRDAAAGLATNLPALAARLEERPALAVARSLRPGPEPAQPMPSAAVAASDAFRGAGAAALPASIPDAPADPAVAPAVARATQIARPARAPTAPLAAPDAPAALDALAVPEARDVLAASSARRRTEPVLAPGAQETERLARYELALRSAVELAGAKAKLFSNQGAGYRRNFNSPPPPPVLQSFQFHSQEGRVQVVDADGSVYEGAVIGSDSGRGAPEWEREVDRTASASKTTSAKAGRATPEAKPDQADDPGRGAVRFQVAGTNVTLQQAVVFVGQYLDPAPVAGGGTGSGGRQGPGGLGRASNRALVSRAPAAQPGTASGVRVIGQATLGGSNQVRIDAIAPR
jgi:hypothetical protein